MKINIWIRKEEAVSGKISKFYNTAPQLTSWPDYFQVTVSQEEFAKLVGMKKNDSMSLTSSGRSEENYTYPQFVEKHYKKERKSDWLVEQYNRNRNPEDWVETREEIPYIYERNGDDVYRRRTGDTERELLTNNEFHSTKKPIKRDLKKLVKELQTIPGAKFDKWWKGLTKDEQIQLTKFWE